MRCEAPLLKRLLAKFVHDVLPAVLASAVGGFLFSHFHPTWMQGPAVAQVEPASAEMMGLLRDEHTLMLNFLKTQVANERKQIAAEDGAPHVIVQPQQVAAPSHQTGMIGAKVSASHAKPTGAAFAPLVIAQARPGEDTKVAAHHDESLLAKTIGIKDHVVAVTERVVSTIGGFPSWLGAIGDRIGGRDALPRPPADLVSAS